MEILPATHGGQRGAGWGLVWRILARHVRHSSGVHRALAGVSLLARSPGCGHLGLVVPLWVRRGGQGLEEAGDVAEAVLGGWAVGGEVVPSQGSRCPCFHWLWLRDDGIELEVLSVHGDVGSQGLQVQVTQVRLGEGKRDRDYSN